ncbi:MAG: N-acetylmuramoyl-L-alanine amidase-like domain-containing protein [Betaproteobacteria bacterium]
MRLLVISFLATAALMSGCATLTPVAEPTAPQLAAAQRAGVDTALLKTLLDKQLYQMSPTEAGRYIAFIHEAEPDFRMRVVTIGRKNIGQAYKLNLLGEYPFELHDNLPMFSLTESDCVVFAEHTYAMALSRSWEEFFWMLQRIRYNRGVIGVTTRNHYTELDWNVNNAWLVTDISGSLAGGRAAQYTMTVDRARFLKNRHKTDSNIPVQVASETYVPVDMVAEIVAQLQAGDFVNVISTKDGEYWASHVGLVAIGSDGTRNFLNSREPIVIEETFEAFIKRTQERQQRNAAAGKNTMKLAGFKFLRLNDAPVVPPMAPQPRPGAVAN